MRADVGADMRADVCVGMCAVCADMCTVCAVCRYVCNLGQHYLGQHCLDQHYLGQHYLGQHYLGQHYLGQHYLGQHYLGQHYLKESTTWTTSPSQPESWPATAAAVGDADADPFCFFYLERVELGDDGEVG